MLTKVVLPTTCRYLTILVPIVIVASCHTTTLTQHIHYTNTLCCPVMCRYIAKLLNINYNDSLTLPIEAVAVALESPKLSRPKGTSAIKEMA